MSKLKVTKYLIYDSLENRWQAPVDSVSEKTDSVFLPSKSQDSLFFFIEKGISCEQNIPSPDFVIVSPKNLRQRV